MDFYGSGVVLLKSILGEVGVSEALVFIYNQGTTLLVLM